MRTTALAVIVAALAAVPVAAQQAPPPVPPAAQQQPPPVQQAPPVQQTPPAQQAPPVQQAPPPSPPVTQGASAGRVEIIEQVLVKVNGEIITKTELENRQVAALRQRAQQMSDDELKKAIAALTPDILVDAVDELLLLQRGKELGYKVTDEQFKRVLDNIRKENKLENDEQFAAALKQEGISIEQLRKNLEKQMVINQVQQVEVAGKVGISESEAQAYYAEHKRRVHDARVDHPARTARGREVGRQDRQRGRRRSREGEGRGSGEARARRRAVRPARRRSLRGAVEGQWRPGGAAVRRRARRGRAQAHRGSQARRGHRRLPHGRRLGIAATRRVDARPW